MPSANYQLLAQAMTERKQVLCVYDGHPRALCPVVLGHRDEHEVVLAYQFAGGSSSGLPRGGQWKCLQVAKISHLELRDGAWHAGASHRRAQSCVEVVDLDVNPASPYRPRRRI